MVPTPLPPLKNHQTQSIRKKSFLSSLTFYLLRFTSYFMPSDRTPRQRIADLLTLAPMTTRQIAAVVKMSERQVEEHLGHIMKTVARERTRRFVLHPSECKACDFVFRDRHRISRPSRCPQCRGELLTDPRFSIEEHAPREADAS